jgi:hypothetical protein
MLSKLRTVGTRWASRRLLGQRVGVHSLTMRTLPILLAEFPHHVRRF